MHCLGVILITFLQLWRISSTGEYGSESEIRDALLRHYNKGRPPVTKPSFDYYFSFFNLFGLDDKSGKLMMRAGISLGWKDERLRWNSDPDIHIHHLTTNVSSIWKPQRNLFNSFEPTHCEEGKIHLYDDGSVYWFRGCTLYTVCIPVLRYFPFDQQVCHVDLGLWAEDEDVPSGNPVYVYSEWFNSHTAWSFVGYKTPKNATYSVNKESVYPVQRLSFILQRSLPLLALGLSCPALLCCLVGLLPFWVEPNSPVRLALGCTSLIVLTTLLQKLVMLVPYSSNSTPIIVIYCAACYWSAFLSTLQTIIAGRWDRQSAVSSSVILGCIRSLPRSTLRILGLAARAYSSFVDSDCLVGEDDDQDGRKDDTTVWWSHVVAICDLAGFILHFIFFLLLTISVCITE